MDGINCPATRTSKHLPTQPQVCFRLKILMHYRQHSVEQQHLSVKFRKTNQSCADRAGVLPHLLPFIRETNAYRYLWSWKGTTIAASASHVDRNLFKLLLLGEESKIRRETGKKQPLTIEIFLWSFRAWNTVFYLSSTCRYKLSDQLCKWPEAI